MQPESSGGFEMACDRLPLAQITIDVGDGYSCELSISDPRCGPPRFEAVWSPSAPPKPTQDMLDRYRVGRNQLLNDIAEQYGIEIAVVEV